MNPGATGTFEFFAVDTTVASLEAAVAAAPARPQALIALAWQLRQRAPERALALADAAAAQLAATDPDTGVDTGAGRLAARLLLIRGEAHWLSARLAPAEAAAAAALRAFSAVQDDVGRADAHWLLAMLAIDRGDWQDKDLQLEAMAGAARGHDPVRVAAAQAAQAYFAVFRERASAAARWGARFAPGGPALHPAAGCWAADFLAVCAHHASDFVPAIRHFIDAYTLALASGQPRRAVIAATNTGDCLNHLNDYHGALEWMQRGLQLARQAGWPGSMGVALLQTAHTLRLLDRLDASRAMLNEALTLMAPLAASRNHAYALWHLSEVDLAAHDYPAALRTCASLAERADALQQADLQSFARCGQARALLALGRPQEALAAADGARRFADGAPNLEIAALRVMAEIHAAHALPAPADVRAASVPLHYLQQALALAAGIERLTVPAALLDATAREYARLGDFEQAYAFSQRAGQSRETSRNQEASNRAVAMQVTHETDRARAEADHQRRLAQAHAERLATLEQLGRVGREITRHLDPAAILAALDQQVHSLLDAGALLVYRMSADGRALEMALGVAAGRALPPRRIALDDPASPAARCAREERELVVDAASDVPDLPSLMCAPLSVAGHVLGVMAIRSVRPRAYSERELAVFRTLCAYAAIALANADAQAQLLEKNTQLEVLSVSDSLTGLYNRLRLDQVLKEELARRARSGADLSVILIDLDLFKSVNDLHGHPVGDQVLATVATLLREGSRQVDVAGRWGGEEFLVICRDTGLAGAVALAEKLRALIAGHPFAVAGPRTGSFGVAALRDREDIEALMARADAALYRAKHGGRNRVETEHPAPDGAPLRTLNAASPDRP